MPRTSDGAADRTPAAADRTPTSADRTPAAGASVRKRLHLNAFLMSVGHHEAAWRLPDSPAGGGTDIAHYQNLARIAERGKLDSVFLADSPVLHGDPGRRPSSKLEPTVLLTALAVVTSRIGLIATASTSYNEPFNLARRFASLDHVSGGRAGWNIVTTAGADAARNFGLDDTPLHHERYERAAEFVDVATKLWDSWADDAVVADKERGVHARADRVRRVDHRGAHFRVDGPLNVERSPQGRPLLVQAGSSEDGKEFAARYAEAVFTAQQTLEDGITFYRDVKQRAVAFGRDPDEIKILPGIVPVIGDTEAEARELDAELERLIAPEYAKRQLAQRLRIAPEDLDLDSELPDDIPTEDEIEGAKSRYTLIVDLARRERLTVRQLIGRLGGGRGHRTFAGTAEQVADTIEHWYESGAADGFNIMPAVLPSGLERFVDRVVPILQERGLFRTEYDGTTLREHYGLARPANQYFDTPSADGAADVTTEATADVTAEVTAQVEASTGEGARSGRSAAALVDAR
ncbi:LLM class flavin-dependent oxidoreductase [Streptomyces sp. NPDC046316]|uniref:LLM class flavin-dependent oxidoreductase n=1 Tax=Streptomyces sp. NPDC046316 TaxID=3154494 RepID=UPI0033F284CD